MQKIAILGVAYKPNVDDCEIAEFCHYARVNRDG